MGWLSRRKQAAKDKRVETAENDIIEARELRQEARDELAEVIEQRPTVGRITGYLNERGAFNHFGEDVEISFLKRGTGDGRRAG